MQRSFLLFSKNVLGICELDVVVRYINYRVSYYRLSEMLSSTTAS
jgi:hypothetical protein